MSGRWAKVSWVAYLVGIAAVAMVADSLPFIGTHQAYAAGGRAALRVFALAVPLAISVATWAIALYRGEVRWRYTPFLWWILGLAAAAGVSTAFAMDKSIAVFGYLYGEQGLLMWLMYFTIALLGSQFITSRARLITLGKVLLASATYVAIIALLEVAGVRVLLDNAPDWMYERGASTMMNPDFLGTFLVIPTVLGIGLAAAVGGRRRWVIAGALTIVVASLTFSLTRGAWFGAFVGLVALSLGVVSIQLQASRLKRLEPVGGAGYVPAAPGLKGARGALARVGAIWVALILTLTVILFVVPGTQRIVERAVDLPNAPSQNLSTLSGRTPLWTEVWRATLNRPIVGAGPDNLSFAWQEAASEATIRTTGAGVVVNSSHNIFLDIAVEFGIPFAIALIVGIAWLALRASIGTYRATKADHFQAWESVALVGAVVGILAALIVGMAIVPIMVQGFVLLGALLGADGRKGARQPSRTASGVVVAAASIYALALLAWGVVSFASAVAGNQDVPSIATRARHDIAAVKIAPWRIYPTIDLVAALSELLPEAAEQIGVTVPVAYERMLAADPLRSLNYYNAGDYALTQQDDAITAIEMANRSLELQPINIPALMLRGDALCAQGNFDDGLSDLAQAVRLESCATSSLSWPPPWTVYMGRLLDVAESDPTRADALATAAQTLAAFEARFPDNEATADLKARIQALGGN